MFPIIFLCSILFLGYCPPAFAEDPYIIPIGQNQIFTQCNYHNSSFIADLIPGYPEPWLGEKTSPPTVGNEANLMIKPNPGYAGRNFFEIGVQFQWDLKGYNWDDIKDWPVKVTFEVSYNIEAQYLLENGSSNVNLVVAGFLDPGPVQNSWTPVPGVNCLDGIGSETLKNGIKSVNNKLLTFVKKKSGSPLTVETLFNKVFISGCCQAYSIPEKNGNNYSSAYIKIETIKIEFLPRKTYGLFIGINNPPIGELDKLHGVESAEFVMASWAQLREGEFQLLPGDFGYTVNRTLTIDTIKSKVNENLNAKKPGDNFIFYFCGHGGLDISKGKEFVRISETEILYKDELKDLLSGVWAKGLNIWVILDSCRSGRFWDNALEFYDHTCLIASAEVYSYADPVFGYGLFSLNLAQWLREQRTNKTLDVNGDTVIDFSEFKNGIQTVTKVVEGYIGQPVSIMGNGETVIFSLDMWAPFIQKSADFNAGFYGEPVTHKTMPWMMLLLD